MLRHNVVLTFTDVSEDPNASTYKVKAQASLTLTMMYYSFPKRRKLFASRHVVKSHCVRQIPHITAAKV